MRLPAVPKYGRAPASHMTQAEVSLRYNALVRESMQKLDFAAALRNDHGELAHAHWTADRSRVEVSWGKSGVPKIDHPVYL